MGITPPGFARPVPQDLVAHLGRHTGHQQPRRAGVAQVMDMQPGDPGPPAHPIPRPLQARAAAIGFAIGIGFAARPDKHPALPPASAAARQVGERDDQLAVDRHPAILAG